MAAPPPVPPVPDSDRYWSGQLDATPVASAPVPFPIYGDATDIDVILNGTKLPPQSWSLISQSNPALTLDQVSRPIEDAVVMFFPAISAGLLEFIGNTRPRQATMPTAPGIVRREFNQTVGGIVSTLRELWRRTRVQGGALLRFDAAGPILLRGAYELTSPPFLFLQTDDPLGRIVYFAKLSSDVGDWSGPLVATGASGKDADAVATDRRVASLWTGDAHGSPSPGGAACLTVMADGSARAWGVGTDCGNGDSGGGARWLPRTLQFAAANAVAPKLPFLQAARCGSSMYLLDSAGFVFSMGGNAVGQLGVGDTNTRAKFTLVASLRNAGILIASIVTQPGAGGYSGGSTVYFRTTTGQVYACGGNASGQVGDGSTVNRSVPVRCGTLTGVSKVSVGVDYNRSTTVMALTSSRSLYAWGANTYGQVGDGTTNDRASPFLTQNDVTDMAVCNGSSGATKGGHALAVKLDGTLIAIGCNSAGQLGLNDTTNRNAWTPIPGVTSASKVYAAGGVNANSAAVLSDGSVRTWGANASGQVGNSSLVNRRTPYSPPGLFQGKVTAVHMFGSTGDGVNMIVLLCNDGSIYGCGANGSGSLGQGNAFANLSVFAKIPLPPGATSPPIACKFGGVVGTDSSFFVLCADGSMWATGGNADGRLGTQAGSLHAIDGLERVTFA